MVKASAAEHVLARVGELLRTTLDDSESKLDEFIEQMTEQLAEANNHASVGRDEEFRLDAQVQTEERAAIAWEKRAMSAVRAGDDVTARDALLKKSRHEQRADEFRPELSRQRAELGLLGQAMVSLNLRLEQCKKRSATLLPGGQHKPLAKAVPDRREEGAMAERAGAWQETRRAKR
jgi:phage shock protein A